MCFMTKKKVLTVLGVSLLGAMGIFSNSLRACDNYKASNSEHTMSSLFEYNAKYYYDEVPSVSVVKTQVLKLKLNEKEIVAYSDENTDMLSYGVDFSIAADHNCYTIKTKSGKAYMVPATAIDIEEINTLRDVKELGHGEYLITRDYTDEENMSSSSICGNYREFVFVPSRILEVINLEDNAKNSTYTVSDILSNPSISGYLSEWDENYLIHKNNNLVGVITMCDIDYKLAAPIWRTSPLLTEAFINEYVVEYPYLYVISKN